MTRFLVADEVAKVIGIGTGATFLAARNRLQREQGFPAPMPTSQRPLRWREDAVNAWVSLQGQIGQQGPAIIPGGNVVLMREAARA